MLNVRMFILENEIIACIVYTYYVPTRMFFKDEYYKFMTSCTITRTSEWCILV